MVTVLVTYIGKISVDIDEPVIYIGKVSVMYVDEVSAMCICDVYR